jgi:hypothetical protein
MATLGGYFNGAGPPHRKNFTLVMGRTKGCTDPHHLTSAGIIHEI